MGDFDPDRITPDEDEITRFTQYQKDRARFIQQGLKGSMPVIAFIDANPRVPGSDEIIEDYQVYYSDLHESDKPGELLFIRTFQGAAVPCLTHQDDYAILNEDTRIDNWNELGAFFAELGVQKIILRGRNLAFEEKDSERLDTAYTLYLNKHPELKDDPEQKRIPLPSRCVGDALVNLEVRGFDVKLSRLTYPETNS